MSELIERLREGKERARGEFVPWHCREGHVQNAHPESTGVWCGKAGHRGTNEMRRVDLYPNWIYRDVREAADV